MIDQGNFFKRTLGQVPTTQRKWKCLLWQEVCVVIVIRQFVQEGPRLQDEGGQHHLGQIHARSHLLQQSPDERFILLRHRLCLGGLASLEEKHTQFDKWRICLTLVCKHTTDMLNPLPHMKMIQHLEDIHESPKVQKFYVCDCAMGLQQEVFNSFWLERFFLDSCICLISELSHWDLIRLEMHTNTFTLTS